MMPVSGVRKSCEIERSRLLLSFSLSAVMAARLRSSARRCRSREIPVCAKMALTCS